MKFLSKSFALIIAISIFTSCSDSDSALDDVSNNDNQIRLSSSVNLLRSNLQNTQIENGQKISFRVTDHTTGSALYPNVQLTADGEGLFSYATTMYYPSNGNNVDFYAYHPYSTDVNAESSTTIPFSIQTAQDEQSNYLQSDLLYATKSNVSRTNEIVPVSFNHKLSKLSFTVTKGDGIDISKLEKIEVLNVLPSTEMNLLTGALSASSGTATTVTAFGVEGGEANVASLSGSSAIVIPQTIAASTAFLRISIDNVTFTYAPENEIVLESGKNYHFNITVNMGSIRIESSIVDWDSTPGTTNGNGVMD